MFKRGIGHYVVLALCVLGLVLQPTLIFAAQDYQYNALTTLLYNWRWTVHDTFNTYGSRINVYNDDYDSEMTAIYIMYEFFGESPSMGFQARDVSEGSSHILNVRAFPLNDWTLSRGSGSNLVYFYANKATWAYVGNFSYDPNNMLDSILDGIDSQFNRSNFNAGNWFYLGNGVQPGYISVSNSNGLSVSSKYPKSTSNSTNLSPDFTFTLDTSSSYNPDLPSSDVLPPDIENPDDPDGLLANYLYYFIRSNFFYRDGNSVLNDSWVPVSQYLTYDMFCKLNILDSTVVVGNNEMPNYLNLFYGEMTAILAAIDSIDLDSIDSNIADIKSDLETAFPAEESEINAAIADAIMDTESDNHISAAGIVQSKSDLDEGLSAFEVDTSGSVYSSPFAAISNPDNWLFFSQDTAANLQVQPVEATLQGVDNSSDLPYYNSVNQQVNNMMGWGD